jgi:hypothetical protein
VVIPKETEYLVRQVDNTWVVWLAGANRFVQFKEPAFFVFEQWSEGTDLATIAQTCAVKYDLPLSEAERFTSEIIGETEKLYQNHLRDAVTQSKLCGSLRVLCGSPRLNCTVLTQSTAEKAQSNAEVKQNIFPLDNKNPVSSSTCMIHGKTIRFIYAETELEDLFRPMFRQFEVKGMEQGAKSMGRRAELAVRFNGRNQNNPSLNQIDFFRFHGNYAFRVDDQEPQTFGANDMEHFQGAALLEILNILHEKSPSDWMAVFHASAVSFGEKALLLTADSGGGKSTLAAFLVANGGRLISDDFVPVSLEDPKVFPLPSALSVKKGAIPVLEDFFPVLRQLQEEWSGESELFLPLPEERIEGSPVRAEAIVFFRYEPSAGFKLTRESNLEMMNALMKQSWIPGNADAAKSFLKWYFSLPVYSLTYSDSEKMTEEIKRIFKV